LAQTLLPVIMDSGFRRGLSWQITPRRLGELMMDPDREMAKRVTEAMLKMVKFDIAALEAAAKG
jgi:hypothetical protein